MRKSVALLVLFFLILAAPALALSDWQYEKLEDGSLMITGHRDKEIQQLEIPEEIGGKKVTAIGDKAFSEYARLKKVVIGQNIRHIGEAAFSDCDKLTQVSIQKGLETLGDGVFKYCDSLKTLALPYGVTHIPKQMCDDCSALENVMLPASVESIGNKAFEDCANLTRISLPQNLKTMGYQVFSSCASLTTLTLPPSVKSIGDNAFGQDDPSGINSTNRCFRLVVEPGSYGEIYCQKYGVAYEFEGEDGYFYLPLDDGAAITGYQGPEMEELTLPTQVCGLRVTSIAPYAFSDLSSTLFISVPSSVINIDRNAFYGCFNLECVAITRKTTSISDDAFMHLSEYFYLLTEKDSYTVAYAKEHNIPCETID